MVTGRIACLRCQHKKIWTPNLLCFSHGSLAYLKMVGSRFVRFSFVGGLMLSILPSICHFLGRVLRFLVFGFAKTTAAWFGWLGAPRPRSSRPFAIPPHWRWKHLCYWPCSTCVSDPYASRHLSNSIRWLVWRRKGCAKSAYRRTRH